LKNVLKIVLWPKSLDGAHLVMTCLCLTFVPANSYFHRLLTYRRINSVHCGWLVDIFCDVHCSARCGWLSDKFIQCTRSVLKSPKRIYFSLVRNSGKYSLSQIITKI